MASFVVTKGHQKDTCCDTIGITCVQNLYVILGLIVDAIGEVCVIN